MLIHLVGKIEIAVLLKHFPVTRAANLAQHSRGFIMRHRLGSDRHDVAMRAYLWRFALSDMQIRRPLLGDDLAEIDQDQPWENRGLRGQTKFSMKIDS